MGNVEPIVVWRARRRAHADVPCGSPPFVLEESCPGCGQRRIAEIVWRDAPGSQRGLFPRIEPHFLCEAGRVVYQDITDAPMAPTDWSTILGHFEETPDQPASSPSAS